MTRRLTIPASDNWDARHARTTASDGVRWSPVSNDAAPSPASNDAARSPAANDATRSLASNGAARSPAVRFDGPPENEEWDVRHGHVRTLAEQ